MTDNIIRFPLDVDAAAARAVLLKQPEVTLSDVYLAASRMEEA